MAELELNEERLLKRVQVAAEYGAERVMAAAAEVQEEIAVALRARDAITKHSADSLVSIAARVWVHEINPRDGGGYKPGEGQIDFEPMFRLNGAQSSMLREPGRPLPEGRYRILTLLLPVRE